MSLTEKLEQDMNESCKNKEKIKLSTIRFLRSQIKNREIDKKTSLTDEEITEIIQKGIRQRKEILPSLERASRQELIEQTNKEIAILESYLPAKLPSEELKQIIVDTIKEVGAAGLRDMGKVIGAVMAKVKGRADGKAVSELVKAHLQSPETPVAP